MKKLFTILAICVAFASFSQTKDNAKPKEMSKESLSKVKSFYELLEFSELLESSEKVVKIIATEIAGKCNGKEMIAETKSAELDSSTLYIFKHADIGSKLFININFSNKLGIIYSLTSTIKIVK